MEYTPWKKNNLLVLILIAHVMSQRQKLHWTWLTLYTTKANISGYRCWCVGHFMSKKCYCQVHGDGFSSAGTTLEPRGWRGHARKKTKQWCAPLAGTTRRIETLTMSAQFFETCRPFRITVDFGGCPPIHCFWDNSMHILMRQLVDGLSRYSPMIHHVDAYPLIVTMIPSTLWHAKTTIKTSRDFLSTHGIFFAGKFTI